MYVFKCNDVKGTYHLSLSFSVLLSLLYYASDMHCTSIKQLSMSTDHLEENLAVLLDDVEKQKPQRKSDNLVTMVCMDKCFNFLSVK